MSARITSACPQGSLVRVCGLALYITVYKNGAKGSTMESVVGQERRDVAVVGERRNE